MGLSCDKDVDRLGMFFPIEEFISIAQYLPILVLSFIADLIPMNEFSPTVPYPAITTFEVIKQLFLILQ